jgi:predicted HAD superfamily Cof-like phosphohydrolase
MARTYTQRRVAEWHALMGDRPVPEIPTNLSNKDREIHAKVCSEEYAEHVVALVGTAWAEHLFEKAIDKLRNKRGYEHGDLVEQVDGAIDSIFVAQGTLWRSGVEDQLYFDEVCDSNDSKAGGGVDVNGKFVKGPNFRPPDIRGLLIRQGWKP